VVRAGVLHVHVDASQFSTSSRTANQTMRIKRKTTRTKHETMRTKQKTTRTQNDAYKKPCVQKAKPCAQNAQFARRSKVHLEVLTIQFSIQKQN
jgi:hypothetical protein